jgi:hypothetical protein
MGEYVGEAIELIKESFEKIDALRLRSYSQNEESKKKYTN